jgi:ribonuclease BN (tRNA processing enzyme)
MLESDQDRVLVDCGASSLIPIKRAGIDPNEIALVLVTHLHGDHFGGLPFLILDGQFSGRSRTLTIAGPPGVEERTNQAMEVLFHRSSGWPREYRTRFIELPESIATSIGSVKVTPHPVVHSCGSPAYGLRVAMAGRTVAYSGDTEWTDSLLDVASGTDLFICESSTYDTPVKLHLDYHTLIEHRQQLGCARLIVTHMGPAMLERASELELECAYDGLEIQL